MATTIQLDVSVNKAKATADIGAIESEVKKLSATPATININVQGAAAAANTLAKIQLEAEKTKQATLNAAAQMQAAYHMSQASQANSASQLAQTQIAAQAQVQTAVQQTAQMQSAAQASMVAAVQNTAQVQIQAEADVQRAIEQTEQTKQRYLTQQERSASQRYAADARVRVQELKNEGLAAREAAGGYSALQVALGTLASRAFSMILRKVTQSIREAVQEMKNVDTQLTNISKVSGKTGQELAAIGDKAYDTASKYGVAASTYLESVYNMQKAGMGDQAEAMGELAIKTMLVGDTTEEVASKFLIASNAAWKLDGNMEKLSEIVDQADYINNNYATTLDKLAAGMPVVASIASQTGMTAQDTLAALGTITAATQESGTKAATALRALILNISGQVGKYLTEEGEEFEVTAKSVKTLQGLLEKYAKTEMDAARAAGEMINPLTAIDALFKGMANEDLNDVELFNLLSGMGGKLRTNQLTALVQNWGTLFADMKEGMAGAAGTADSEISRMMESWERRTQKLKNTWTEFISDIIDTNAVKAVIDDLTKVIDVFDKYVQNNPFAESDTGKQTYADLLSEYDALLKKGKDLNQFEKDRLNYLKEELELVKQRYEYEEKKEAEKLQQKLTAKNAAAYEPGVDDWTREHYGTYDAAAWTDLQGAVSGLTYTGDIASLSAGIKQIVSDGAEYYNQLVHIRDLGVSLTENQQNWITEYESLKAATDAQIGSVELLGNGYADLYDTEGNWLGRVVDGAKAAEDARRKEAEAREEDRKATEQWADDLEEARYAWQQFDESQGQTASETFTTIGEAFSTLFDAINSGNEAYLAGAQEGGDALTSGLSDATSEAGDAASATATIPSGIDSAVASAGRLAAALQAAADAASGIAVGPINIPQAAEGTKNAPGGPTLVNELGPELISENGKAYIANGGRPGIVNLSRGAIVLTAEETKTALRSGIMPRSAAAFGNYPGTGPSIAADLSAAAARAEMAMLRERNRRSSETSTLTPSVTSTYSGGKKRKGGGGGGFAGDAGPTAEELLEEAAKNLKDTLSNIEKQAKLADNREQYDKEASLYGKGQQEIDKMVAAYKKAGYKETDDEILDLLNKRYDYEKKKDAASKKTIENAAKDLKDKLGVLDKQAKLANTEGDYVKEVKFYEQAQEAIKKMVDMYRKAGYKDDSKEILELLQKNYDYADKQVKVYKDQWNNLIDALESDTEAQEVATKLAEKEQALEDARLALENANKQRTIRTFNASTGQWEWVADQSKIKSAQESLTKAEKDYAEEVKDQAIKELERLRDTMADLNNVVLGPALSAIMLKAESSDEFQNFARSLNAVYGIGSYLGSTQGSSKVLSTKDSHDTIYTFGNVTLTEEQASSMSVAELAKKLRVLKIS